MPDTQKELQASEEHPLKTVWFETLTGTRYEMPDMLPGHVDMARADLDRSNNVTAINISNAALIIPRRILKRAGVGDRCFWEVP